MSSDIPKDLDDDIKKALRPPWQPYNANGAINTNGTVNLGTYNINNIYTTDIWLNGNIIPLEKGTPAILQHGFTTIYSKRNSEQGEHVTITPAQWTIVSVRPQIEKGVNVRFRTFYDATDLGLGTLTMKLHYSGTGYSQYTIKMHQGISYDFAEQSSGGFDRKRYGDTSFSPVVVPNNEASSNRSAYLTCPFVLPSYAQSADIHTSFSSTISHPHALLRLAKTAVNIPFFLINKGAYRPYFTLSWTGSFVSSVLIDIFAAHEYQEDTATSS